MTHCTHCGRQLRRKVYVWGCRIVCKRCRAAVSWWHRRACLAWRAETHGEQMRYVAVPLTTTEDRP